MRSVATLVLALAAALLVPACTTEAGPAPADGSAETEAKLCCGGSCGTPEGYCCNPETKCGGACPEDALAWDDAAKAAAAAADGADLPN